MTLWPTALTSPLTNINVCAAPSAFRFEAEILSPVDRSLLGMILDAAIRLLNDFGELISRLLGIPFEAFTSLNAESIVDSESVLR